MPYRDKWFGDGSRFFLSKFYAPDLVTEEPSKTEARMERLALIRAVVVVSEVCITKDKTDEMVRGGEVEVRGDEG